MPQLQHARLSAQDAEELVGCLAKLDSIHDSIKATGMAGRLGLMQLCVEIYRVIERVTHKELRAIARWQAAHPKQTPNGVSGALAAGEEDLGIRPADDAAVED